MSKKYIKNENGIVRAVTSDNLQLEKPLANENYDIEVHNRNMDKIDNAIQEVKGKIDGLELVASNVKMADGTTVQTTVTTNKSNISTLQSEVSANKASILNLTSNDTITSSAGAAVAVATSVALQAAAALLPSEPSCHSSSLVSADSLNSLLQVERAVSSHQCCDGART